MVARTEVDGSRESESARKNEHGYELLFFFETDPLFEEEIAHFTQDCVPCKNSHNANHLLSISNFVRDCIARHSSLPSL